MRYGVPPYEYGVSNPGVTIDPSGMWLIPVGLIVGGTLIYIWQHWPIETPYVPTRPAPGAGEDEMRAIGCCGEDPLCQYALWQLFDMVYYSQPHAVMAPKEPDKCMKWCAGFLEANFPNYVPGQAISMFGGNIITLDPIVVTTPGGAPIPTQKGLVFGNTLAEMRGHCMFRVTIKPRPGFGGGCTAYVDIGYESNQGNFGGEDNWFFSNEPGFDTDLDWTSETHFDPHAF